MCNRADFCGACKCSISDGQIGLADGSDELAVLGKSAKHDCGSHFAHRVVIDM